MSFFRSFNRAALSRTAFLVGLSLFVSTGGALVAQPTSAEEPEESTREEQGVAAPLSGVTIRWQESEQRFGTPSPTQSAVLAEELGRLLRSLTEAEDEATSSAREVSVRRLSNGMTRARLPLERMDFSVVRVGEDGALVFDCVEGPDEARQLLSRPESSQPAEEQ